MAILRLSYRVGAANDYSSSDTYTVSEYYRIRQTNSGFYLLNFEREMNQVFDARNDLTSTAKINLELILQQMLIVHLMKREYIPILLIRVHCGVLTAVHRHLQEYSRSRVRRLIL